jgi:hypothetical protein
MRRVLVVGPAVLTAGGLVIALTFAVHLARAARIDCTLAGLALVAGGASLTAVNMQRLLREEVSLALRTDGIAVQSAGTESFVSWDELERARWDEGGPALVLERRNAAPLVITRRFARIEGPALAARVQAAKRKAAMNLLV